MGLINDNFPFASVYSRNAITSMVLTFCRVIPFRSLPMNMSLPGSMSFSVGEICPGTVEICKFGSLMVYLLSPSGT